MIKRIYDSNFASACFFRSTVQPPQMKVMLQITERCNLRCAHCFAESGSIGNEMSMESIRETIIPQFVKNQVIKVTLTGGEPLLHPYSKEITMLLLENGIGVSICTNGTLIDSKWANNLKQYNNVHFNVSLDGLTLKSHGRFRGITSEAVLTKIKENICMLGEMGLLNGILTTPNKYATIPEYIELCKFAKGAGANYVLMNPLSPFGRGVETQPLAFSTEEMITLKQETSDLMSETFEVVYIRFPNSDHKPIGECPRGSIPYVFCNGDIAVCPYMVFAANGSERYQPSDFIVGNIFDGADIAQNIKDCEFETTAYGQCKEDKGTNCNRGCYAIKISNNQPLSDCDFKMCPINGGNI